KEHQQPVESGLSDQATKKRGRFVGAFLHGSRNPCPKTGASGIRFRFGLVALRVTSQKINRREEQDLKCEAHAEELFIRRRLKPCDAHVEIERANEIENITGDEVTD